MRKRPNKLVLYVSTIRHLRPSQVFWRFFNILRFFIYKVCPPLWSRYYRSNDQPAVRDGLLRPNWSGEHVIEPDRAEVLRRARRIVDGEFTYLNATKRFPGQVDWECPGTSRLWQYQLHYFDFGRDLGRAHRYSGEIRYYECFKKLFEDWLDSNPLAKLDGWHPYTLSLRLVNWVYCFDLFRDALDSDAEFRQTLLQSTYQQASFLAHNLEFQVGGNHLLANIKGLLFAGVFLGGSRPDKWLKTSRKLLKRELREQVLEDGGHFERSPTYHLIVLQDLVECWELMKRNDLDPTEDLRSAIDLMAELAAGLLTPEGEDPAIQ